MFWIKYFSALNSQVISSSVYFVYTQAEGTHLSMFNNEFWSEKTMHKKVVSPLSEQWEPRRCG